MENSNLALRLKTSHLIALLGSMLMVLVVVTALRLRPDQLAPDFGAEWLFQLILCGGIAAALAAPTLSKIRRRERIAATAVIAALLFVLIFVSLFFDIEDLLEVLRTQIDFPYAALWTAGGLLLFWEVTGRNRHPFALASLSTGLALQVLMFLADIFGESIGNWEVTFTGEGVEDSIYCLVLIVYAYALIVSLTTDRTSWKLIDEAGKRCSNYMFNIEYTRPGAMASILFNNIQYRVWQFRHPSATFGEFYAWKVTRKLNRGRAHRTLGKRVFGADNLFGETPELTEWAFGSRRGGVCFKHLLALGLRPNQRVVDYGCGSLRIGQHIIRYLGKDCYWGLDVTDRFFRDGLVLLGESVVAEKAPNCRVISRETLNEVRRLAPDFVVSFAVLKHVPAADLDDYFDKICGLACDRTTILLSFSESARERQISGKSWSWSLARIEKLITERIPTAVVSVIYREAQKARNGVNLNRCLIAVRSRAPGESTETPNN